MSWCFQVSESIGQHSGSASLLKDLQKAAQNNAVKFLPDFASSCQRDEIKRQMITAVQAIELLLLESRTNYSTGCTVVATCEGHCGDETLNYESHHISIRLQVIPIPHHR